MKLLEGKNILITGASRGIGNGIAVTLASHGANIFFTYVNSKDSANALEEKIQKYGVKVRSYRKYYKRF
jgi:3-oxoacyl-[acyl-carrier protein] reductase